MKKAILTICLICLSICLYDGQANTIVEQPTSLNNQTTNNNTNQSAEELEGWTFHTNAKLYYKEGGRWKYFGTYPVYFNHADNDDGCNQWVRFTTYHFMPATYHDNDDLEWPRRVRYQGIYFYF